MQKTDGGYSPRSGKRSEPSLRATGKLVAIIALNRRAVYTPSAPIITEPASGRWRRNSHCLICCSYGLQYFLVILITEQHLKVLLQLVIHRAGVFSQGPKNCLKKSSLWMISLFSHHLKTSIDDPKHDPS